MGDGEQPKIIVDDDWKSQAQAEKARLAEESKAREAKPAEGGAPDRIEFVDLVRMLATQALMYLGAFPDPQTGKAVVSLEYARLHIDLMDVVEEKTKGNLSDEEQKMLAGTLHELRTQYVEIAKAIKKASDEGRIGADGSVQPPSGGDPLGGAAGNIAGPGL